MNEKKSYPKIYDCLGSCLYDFFLLSAVFHILNFFIALYAIFISSLYKWWIKGIWRKINQAWASLSSKKYITRINIFSATKLRNNSFADLLNVTQEFGLVLWLSIDKHLYSICWQIFVNFLWLNISNKSAKCQQNFTRLFNKNVAKISI